MPKGTWKPPRKIRFTERELKAIVPTKDRQEFIYDTETKGLALGLSKGGKKTFYFARWVDGKSKREALGEFGREDGFLSLKEARAEVEKRNAKRAEGKDPNPSGPRRGSPTIEDLFNDHMREKVAKRGSTKTAGVYRSLFECHLRPLANKKALDVTSRMIENLHISIGADDSENPRPYAANRVVELLRAIFNHAAKKGRWDRTNPADGVEPFKEAKRDRSLDPKTGESQRFINALFNLDATGERLPDIEVKLRGRAAGKNNDKVAHYPVVNLTPHLQTVFLIQLFAGLRKQQVHQMQWAEIDFEERTFHTKQAVKSGRELTVPLVDALMERLEALPRTGKYVFPGERGRPFMSDPKWHWPRILKAAKIEDPIVQHGLRHTLGTTIINANFSSDILARILGHRPPAVITGGYAHQDKKLTIEREALETAFAILAEGSILKPKTKE